MTKINNKHGIEMYYEIDTFVDKLNILDSNGKYFDDLYIDLVEDRETDINNILKMLENSTLQEMANFFNKTIYKSLDALTYDLQDPEITEDNEYLNIFKVNDKKYYVWSE